MGNFGFWMGIGAAQAAANRSDGKASDRRNRVFSIIVGILLAWSANRRRVIPESLGVRIPA